MLTNKKTNIIDMSLVTTVLCCIFFSLITITTNSYSIAPISLAIIGLILLHKTMHRYREVDIKYVSIALSSYFILTLISFFVYGGSGSQLDMPSRTVLASLVLCLLTVYKPRIKPILISILIGGIISGLIALHHSYYIEGRAFSRSMGYMSIQISGIIASISLFSVVLFFYFLKDNDKICYRLSYIAFTLGFSAQLLTGSRGAWVLTPLILISILWFHRRYINKKVGLSLIIALIIAGTLGSPQVIPRVEAIKRDISYYQDNDSATSSGARLEMWKSAIYSTLEKPIFGQGFDGVAMAKERQVKAGLVDPVVLKFSRAHNQFFEDLQTKGFIGLGVLLLMFLYPLFYFLNALAKSEKYSLIYTLSLLGGIHVISIMGYSLTQHYLSHHSGVLFYSFGTVIFFALIHNLRKES